MSLLLIEDGAMIGRDARSKRHDDPEVPAPQRQRVAAAHCDRARPGQ